MERRHSTAAEDGAGKSTLVKIMAGNFPPASGELVLEGETVHFHKPVEARDSGVEAVGHRVVFDREC